MKDANIDGISPAAKRPYGISLKGVRPLFRKSFSKSGLTPWKKSGLTPWKKSGLTPYGKGAANAGGE
jgi:hypothetical protein